MESVSGFDVAEIIETAIEKSGGQSALASEVSSARRELYLLLIHWANLGWSTWRIERKEFPFSYGQTYLDLPKEIEDVFHASSVTAVSAIGQQELPMKAIPASEYDRISQKNTPGTPSQYYFERTSTPRLYYYPTGAATGVNSFILSYITWFQTYDRDSTSLEFPRRWLVTCINGVAWNLAKNRIPRDSARIDDCKRAYDESLAAVMPRDQSKTSFIVRLR